MAKTKHPRSPWRPWPVVVNGEERRYCRCFACERYFGQEMSKRELMHLPEPVTIGDVVMEAGWYCRQCLGRAKRPEPPEKV